MLEGAWKNMPAVLILLFAFLPDMKGNLPYEQQVRHYRVFAK